MPERSIAKKRRRAIYVRVSTEAQAEEGYSIPAQTEKLQAYCVAKGWNEPELYIDAGYSGSNLDRPGIRRLIADAGQGQIETVLVYKLDRLSRSQKDTLFLIEDVFLPNDVGFVSLNESLDTTSSYGRAMIGILSAFAQLERENIYQRTRMGMLERVKKGLWRGGGGVPLGYDYDRESGILVPNEQAETVRRMYTLYIEGYSTQKIANMLGIKHERQVAQTLTRRSNLGYITYNGQEYPGGHEAIVSEEVYDLAMQKMRERARSPVPIKTSHLLTGLIYCGCCGAKLRYQKWGKSGFKLVCYSHDPSKAHMVKDPDCPYQAVWAHEIEALVLEDLFHISVDLGNGRIDEDSLLFDPLTALSARMKQTENKLARLYDIYGNEGDTALLGVIARTKDELAGLAADYQEEQENQARSRKLCFLRDQVVRIAESWPCLTDLQRQTLIRDCISKIIIANDRIQIFYTFKKNDSWETGA